MDLTRDASRRSFLRDLTVLAGGAAAAAAGLPARAADEKPPDLVVATGDDAKANLKKAIAEFGGMKRFVSRGDVVVIKPNIAWVRRPETAANTNPDVVAGLIELALEAGAKEVKVFDRTDRSPKDCYESSGIAEVCRRLGAKTFYQNELPQVKIPLKGTAYLKETSVIKAALDCDCYINVPVAKHHGMSILTMTMKNHMGVGDPNKKEWHANIHQALADFALNFKPKLSVLDAFRILVRHGPAGGSLADVESPKKCIVGVDQAAVDAYGTTLFPMYAKKPADIGHVAIAGKMGVGEIDLAKLKIKDLKV